MLTREMHLPNTWPVQVIQSSTVVPYNILVWYDWSQSNRSCKKRLLSHRFINFVPKLPNDLKSEGYCRWWLLLNILSSSDSDLISLTEAFWVDAMRMHAPQFRLLVSHSLEMMKNSKTSKWKIMMISNSNGWLLLQWDQALSSAMRIMAKNKVKANWISITIGISLFVLCS